MHNADQSERIHFKFLLSQENRSLNTFLQLTVTVCRLHGTRPIATMHIKMVTLTGVVQSIRGWRKARRKPRTPRTPRPIPSSRSRDKLRQKPSKYSCRVQVSINNYFIRLLLFVGLKHYTDCVNKLLL